MNIKNNLIAWKQKNRESAPWWGVSLRECKNSWSVSCECILNTSYWCFFGSGPVARLRHNTCNKCTWNKISQRFVSFGWMIRPSLATKRRKKLQCFGFANMLGRFLFTASYDLRCNRDLFVALHCNVGPSNHPCTWSGWPGLGTQARHAEIPDDCNTLILGMRFWYCD